MDLIENPYVSEFTQKTLEQFGWQKGHAIPEKLGPLLLKIKETLPESKRADVLIDAELMSDEDKDKVKKMLARAREVDAENKKKADKQAKVSAVAGKNAGIAEAYSKVLDQLEVLDDREEDGTENNDEKNEKEVTPPVAETAEQPKTEQAAQTDTASAALNVLPFCQRCGWDNRIKFEAEPTERDKEDFLATLLGNNRFKKHYELFGGKMRVLFRGLSAEENKLIYRQLVLDQQENKIATEAEWFLQMLDYRMSCSLEQITDKNGKVLVVMPELKEQSFQPDPEQPLATALTKQLAYLNENVLTQEATKRLVGTQLRQFQRLVEALEAMALEPSFWNGIE